ncbi:MAG: hypothetical protein ACI8RD_005850, partial [Bacillariaceae sp.]
DLSKREKKRAVIIMMNTYQGGLVDVNVQND